MSKILIDEAYRPKEDEPFMNERQREYFRRKLIKWKGDILREAQETLATLQNENENHPDIADRASSETDRAIELRARDRQRKLIAKIDAALARIEEAPTAIARRPASRSPSSASKRGPSRPFPSRRKNVTSATSASTGTTSASDPPGDSPFGIHPMLTLRTAHRSAQKTGSHFPHDAPGPTDTRRGGFFCCERGPGGSAGAATETAG